MTTPSEREALALAIKFHETYERLAPQFGYETRADTKVFDPESKNGRLMVAVCAALASAPAQAGVPKLSDELIQQAAETLGKHIPGLSNFDSWGCGYRLDSRGEYTIPSLPANVIPFARAIEVLLATQSPPPAEPAPQVLPAFDAIGAALGVEADSPTEQQCLTAIKRLKAAVNDLTHQVICCGVAASHPDATLTTRGAYAEKWNSAQAEQVRELRRDRDSLRATYLPTLKDGT